MNFGFPYAGLLFLIVKCFWPENAKLDERFYLTAEFDIK